MADKNSILVTGAGSGIGRAVAEALAKSGHCVHASMRATGTDNKGRAEEMARLAATQGLDLRVVELDVLSEPSCRAAVDQVLAEQGRTDVVINNAGMLMTGMTAAAASLVATASWAASPVVTENLTGMITGSQTVDTMGYFGKAGADLSRATVAIYLQYVPGLLGPSQTCRNHFCTYNESTKMPDTQGSLLVTISINGHRLVYSPSYEAAIFFPTQAPNQLTIDSDAFSGFGVGLPGL